MATQSTYSNLFTYENIQLREFVSINVSGNEWN